MCRASVGKKGTTVLSTLMRSGVLTNFCSTSSADENLSDDIDQLFELTKIMVLVLSGLVPGLEDSNTKGIFAIL